MARVSSAFGIQERRRRKLEEEEWLLG